MSEGLFELSTSNPFDALRKRTKKQRKPNTTPGRKPWKRRDNVIQTENACFIRLQAGEELAWTGLCRFAVVVGCVSIGGLRVKGNERSDWKSAFGDSKLLEAYSPKASASLSWINVGSFDGPLVQHGRPISKTLNQLFKKVEAKWDLKEIQKNDEACLMIIKDDSGLASLSKESSHFREIWDDEASPFGVPGFVPYPSSSREGSPTFAQDLSWPILSIADSWTETFQKMESGKRIIAVVGPRNTGKSTFCRCLVNHLISLSNQVAYMETDVGQGQFVPLGCVGVGMVGEPALGPGFCLPIFDQCHFFGSTSPKTDPDYYLALLQRCLTDAPKDSTLVINTHGWIQGMGFDLLSQFISIAGVTDLIYLSKTDDTLAQDLAKDGKMSVHLLQPAPGDARRFGALDFRNLSILSYLYSNSSKWQFDPPLALQVPYAVGWTHVSLRFMHGTVPIAESLNAINGTLVALCHDSSIFTLFKGLAIQQSGLTQPDPDSTIFVGLGIVRGVDLDTEVYHIITPVHVSKLSRVNTLLRPCDAGLNLPISLLVRGWEGEALPFVQMGIVDGIGGKVLGRRIQLPRKRLS
jgi:polynucleotide 5'-kinase involved in rRNA processing